MTNLVFPNVDILLCVHFLVLNRFVKVSIAKKAFQSDSVNLETDAMIMVLNLYSINNNHINNTNNPHPPLKY